MLSRAVGQICKGMQESPYGDMGGMRECLPGLGMSGRSCGKRLKISRRCRNPDRKGWQGWEKGGVAANPGESEAWL